MATGGEQRDSAVFADLHDFRSVAPSSCSLGHRYRGSKMPSKKVGVSLSGSNWSCCVLRNFLQMFISLLSQLGNEFSILVLKSRRLGVKSVCLDTLRVRIFSKSIGFRRVA